MQHDLELLKISERLKDRCNCVDCNDEATISQYLERFFKVLARLFCWVDSECDTILKSFRHETIPLDKVEICGCDAMIEVKPYYFKGFDPSTLKVYVHKRQGMSRETFELTAEDYDWSFVEGTLLVNLTEFLSPCCRCDDPCSCEAQYKLILDYEAGYTSETIPDCVIEAMCHFLNVFMAYQNNCGSLDDCSNMDRLAVGAVLKQKSVDYIVREWKIDNDSMDRIYVKMINKWYLQTLASLSLCNTVYTDRMYIAIGKGEKC